MDINYDSLIVDPYEEFPRGLKRSKLLEIVNGGVSRVKINSKGSGIVTFLKFMNGKTTIVQTHRPGPGKVVWRVTKITSDEFWTAIEKRQIPVDAQIAEMVFGHYRYASLGITEDLTHYLAVH